MVRKRKIGRASVKAIAVLSFFLVLVAPAAAAADALAFLPEGYETWPYRYDSYCVLTIDTDIAISIRARYQPGRVPFERVFVYSFVKRPEVVYKPIFAMHAVEDPKIPVEVHIFENNTWVRDTGRIGFRSGAPDASFLRLLEQETGYTYKVLFHLCGEWVYEMTDFLNNITNGNMPRN